MRVWGDPDGAGPPFESPYRHGFVWVAVGVPRVRVAQPRWIAAGTIALARRASDAGAALVVFPELGISAYSNEDSFHHQALTSATLDGVREFVEASTSLLPLIAVGAPLVVEQRLFNTAIVITAAASWVSCRRATCRTTARSTRSANSARRATPRGKHSGCSAATSRSVRT